MDRRSLLLKAIEDAKNTAKTCERTTPIPDASGRDGEERKAWLAIFETAALAKGRAQAFEACLDAMNGNTRMLQFYARLLG